MIDFYIEPIKEDGVDKVKVTLGSETRVLSLEEAFTYGEALTGAASLPGELAHINSVFENWGSDSWTDGGTC